MKGFLLCIVTWEFSVGYLYAPTLKGADGTGCFPPWCSFDKSWSFLHFLLPELFDFCNIQREGNIVTLELIPLFVWFKECFNHMCSPLKTSNPSRGENRKKGKKCNVVWWECWESKGCKEAVVWWGRETFFRFFYFLKCISWIGWTQLKRWNTSGLGWAVRIEKNPQVSVVESAFASRSPKLKVAVGFLLSALSAADLSKQEVSYTPSPVGAVGYCCYGCIGLRALAILRLSDIQVTKAP